VAAIRDNLQEWGDYSDEATEAAQAISPGRSRLDPICRISLRDNNSQQLQHILSKQDVVSGNACEKLNLPKTNSRRNLAPSDQLIWKAYEYFHKRIQEMGATKTLELFENVKSKVYLLVCIPANIRIARNLVMGLGKGKNLEPVDEFKGMVCFNSIKDNETLQDHTMDKWNRLCDEKDGVGRENLEDACIMLAQIGLRRRVQKNGEMDLMEEFLKQYMAKYDKKDGADFFDEQIVRAAETLAEFRKGHVTLVTSGSNAPNDLPSLSFFNSAAQIQVSKEIELVVLHLLIQWGLTSDDDEKIALERSLRKLERIAVWMMLTKPTPTVRFKRCFEIIDMINDGGPVGPCSPLDLTCEENEMVIKMINETAFGKDFAGIKTAKAILERLNEFSLIKSSQGRVNPIESKALQLEHVLPQGYKTVNEWTLLWDAKDATTWMHRFGNLALLNQKVNAGISNGSFERKKNHLDSSPYPLTRQMAAPQHANWDLRAVKTHHEMVANLATQVWNLEDSTIML
jgi:hypothetical protein